MQTERIIDNEPDKRVYKKISISIESELLKQLEEERRTKGISVSGNLTRAVTEKTQNLEVLKYLQQELQQKTLLLENNLHQLEQERAEAEKYRQYKQRGYLSRVLRVLFALD